MIHSSTVLTEPLMLKVLLAATALMVGVEAHAIDPVIDNERVTVWDTTVPLPPARHEFVAVSLTRKGTAVVGHAGELPAPAGEHTVVIELKDHRVPALPNVSGYPNAFPRPRVQKLFETDRFTVWSYRWIPGEPTPMHFHDKDVLVVYQDETTLRSTTPDGQATVNAYKDGEIRFNQRDRVHTELLLSPQGSAVMTELK
jgi:hypothetical protein